MNENMNIKLALIEKHLKAYEEALALMPKIKECLASFDGKQLNKRIDTALKKIDDRLRFEPEYNSCNVNMLIRDRMIVEDGMAHYLKDAHVYILNGCLYYGGDESKSCETKDGKFNADGMLYNYDVFVDGMEDLISSVRKCVSEIDDRMKERERIKKEIEEYNNSIPWMVNSYFENRFRFR